MCSAFIGRGEERRGRAREGTTINGGFNAINGVGLMGRNEGGGERWQHRFPAWSNDRGR
jgi:hypothetical protein